MGCGNWGPRGRIEPTTPYDPPTRLPCYISEVTASSLVAQPSISSDLEIGTSISWLKRRPPPLPPHLWLFLGPPPYLWLPISFGVILSSWRVVLIYLLFFSFSFLMCFFPLLIFSLQARWTWPTMVRWTHGQSEPAPTSKSSTGCPLRLSSGWTLTELTSDFTLVTHSITRRSYTFRKIGKKIDDFQVLRWFISLYIGKDYFLLLTS
jgi:hypothetical protein